MADQIDVIINNSLPSSENHQNNKKVSQLQKKNNRKRKKKFARRNLHGVNKNKKKETKIALSMSTWAESFTVAATWQIKHQLAYWKARAKALEYENRVLHDIIKKKNYIGATPDTSVLSECDSESDSEEFEHNVEEEGNLEVSEEYIQFLQENAKYKEDARRERERLKAKSAAEEDDAVAILEAGPSAIKENVEENLQQLYGDKWQRIEALEMSLQSKFINDCDQEKPMYWPNIPFNFNF